MLLLDQLSFAVIINFAVAFAVVASAILAVFYIIKWWIMSITAWWDPEKLKQGMHAIRYSVVWLFVVIIAVFIVKIIWAILWVELLKYLSYENIIAMLDVIIERLEWNYDAVNNNPF